jgi:methylenetetrahydrofolate reductase (NADPH)
MLGKYRDDAGIMEALLIAGSMKAPIGAFGSSIELLETGLFERFVIVNG